MKKKELFKKTGSKEKEVYHYYAEAIKTNLEYIRASINLNKLCFETEEAKKDINCQMRLKIEAFKGQPIFLNSISEEKIIHIKKDKKENL